MRFFYLRYFFSIIILFTTSIVIAGGIECKNTNNGTPKNEGGILVCTIEETFNRNGNLSNDTFGIIKSITARIPLTISTDLTKLSSMFTQRGIQIPVQQLSVEIETSEGKKLPADITAAPSLGIAPGISFGCEFKFNSFSPGVSDLRSSYLPDWVRNGLVNILNNNDQIKEKALENANTLLAQALAKSLSCQN